MSDSPEIPVLLTRRRFAELLDVSLATLDRMNAGGLLPPAVRVGRGVRWRREDILTWISEGCPDRPGWDALHPRRPGPARAAEAGAGRRQP